ncbi:Mannosylfructose-phosphate phosphatase [Bhargavaea cecembensis DSE10]|uniref:Mannosylfructose-phosphate phosphatase n=1 Tax=Bhargavaea cecembensis DSE10 TaxID=1235279 RepID=M7P2X6_9BACL|nr:HAD-IIB family hydrolase [Bhargavaea cecembensis]EMR04904.1 Mannosylfructose-phosphate phosphatase [Bhargavaea cecembensis DSE10]
MQKIRYLLATDLDGTFVGDEAGLRELLDYYDSLPDRVALAYVTGRHRASAMELIRGEELPVPDILITDVGTSVFAGPELAEDPGWSRRMTENWEPQTVRRIAGKIPGIRLQDLPDTRRVSFFSEGGEPAEKLRQALLEEGVPHTYVFSSGRDVDILPEGGGKGEALRYVIGKFADGDARILIAGDSGNDLDMLMLGYPAVMVSNAQPELLEAEGHDALFRATRPCAGGILEAWMHFYGNTADIKG